MGASFSIGSLEKDEVVLAREMCSVLTGLGPTFVKLGQLLSSRSDLVSPGVAAELSRLQSNVAPFRDEDAIRAIEAELQAPLSAVFAEFQPRAVAAASLAQVKSRHCTRLRLLMMLALSLLLPLLLILLLLNLLEQLQLVLLLLLFLLKLFLLLLLLMMMATVVPQPPFTKL